MDWLHNMNNTMDYIETHLLANIDYDQVARIACCSTYHFQRMFSFITGVPLSEYIRRRRLTLAAFELQNSNAKVIDTAFKYGYESPEAFSRAFKKMHGVTPMSVHDRSVMLKAYPRMSFHISIKGDIEMNYRIEQKEAFDFFGVSTDIDATNPFVEIPVYWNRCISDETVDNIRKAAGLGENAQIHAALHHFRDGVFSYMIGYYLPKSGLPLEYEKLSIPPLTWAIFSTGLYPNGKGDVHSIWKRIWSEWFPTSNYEHADGPELEMTYDRGNNMYEMEVWIPVVEK